MAYYDRIREARLNAKMTQEQLANLVGVSKSTITSYEKGTREMPAGMLFRIAKATGAGMPFLTQDEESNDESTTAAPFSEEISALVAKYQALDRAGKDAVHYAIDHESARCVELSELRRKIESECHKIVEMNEPEIMTNEIPAINTKIIPLLRDFAAGPGSFADIPWEDYEVPSESPAEFAIKVNGQSMEPYFPDGMIAFGIRKEPKAGEVAAVFVDGSNYVKQYCSDMYGNVYLFSLNRAEKDMKLMVVDGHAVMVWGKILTDQKIPELPTSMNE